MKKVLFVVVASFSISACATVNTTMQEYYDKTLYKITEYECKMFNAEKFGKCMREHYPRVEEDYSWKKNNGTTSSD